jgi:hypothetical protein
MCESALQEVPIPAKASDHVDRHYSASLEVASATTNVVRTKETPCTVASIVVLCKTHLWRTRLQHPGIYRNWIWPGFESTMFEPVYYSFASKPPHTNYLDAPWAVS